MPVGVRYNQSTPHPQPFHNLIISVVAAVHSLFSALYKKTPIPRNQRQLIPFSMFVNGLLRGTPSCCTSSFLEGFLSKWTSLLQERNPSHTVEMRQPRGISLPKTSMYFPSSSQQRRPKSARWGCGRRAREERDPNVAYSNGLIFSLKCLY